jgi:filamentous hemagglutinin
MRAGKAPQRFNPDKGGMESMELSHEPIPARGVVAGLCRGGGRITPRWIPTGTRGIDDVGAFG